MDLRTSKVDPIRDLADELSVVEMPSRYLGGEFGQIVREDSSLFRVALTFPDLYEIGMSNLAIKLLYGSLNLSDMIAAERVFVPAPDFEEALQRTGTPLYTLETGTPVGACDVLAISFGYELLATNVITLLKCSGIALEKNKRGAGDPIVIAGGPGITNPMPLAPFIDGFFIGEAEEELAMLMEKAAQLKTCGASRSDILDEICAHRSVWSTYVDRPAYRAIWHRFADRSEQQGGIPRSYGAGFPVPSMRVVQDHGVTEIMRGCPQGCRFCHAGNYYRPYRMKPVDVVLDEVDWLVHKLGYRQITLSSLSSGDYRAIYALMNEVNTRYRHLGVSFQLPSLRVDSFTLPLLEQMSAVKKSSLTFAVESPDEYAQRGVNKMVPIDQVAEILRSAKESGWKHAKLYFMIGLPGPESESEAEQIVEYLYTLRRRVRLDYVANIGTFIPKPHTAFQWQPQLDPDTAHERLRGIADAVPRGVTVKWHDPWLSWLEGVICRGDERTADAIVKAHDYGARLDAWSEYLDKSAWQRAVSEVVGSESGLSGFAHDAPLPWDGVRIGVTSRALLTELDRSNRGLLTERCAPECKKPCGVCNRDVRPVEQESDLIGKRDDEADQPIPSTPQVDLQQGRAYILLAQFEKTRSAAYLSHLSVIRTLERIWNRVDIPLELSEGYAPKIKMSFGQPLPLGVESRYEIVSVAVQNTIQLDNIFQAFQTSAPNGIRLTGAALLHHENNSPKIPAPMTQYGGSRYEVAHDVIGTFRNVAGPGIRIIEGPDQSSIVEISAEAPGLGRLLGERRRTTVSKITRIGMWNKEDAGDLFEWYRPRAIDIRYASRS